MAGKENLFSIFNLPESEIIDFFSPPTQSKEQIIVLILHIVLAQQFSSFLINWENICWFVPPDVVEHYH